MNRISNKERKCRSEKHQQVISVKNQGQLSRDKIKWGRKMGKDVIKQRAYAKPAPVSDIDQVLVKPCPCGKGFIANTDVVKLIEDLNKKMYQMKIHYENKLEDVKSYYIEKIKNLSCRFKSSVERMSETMK